MRTHRFVRTGLFIIPLFAASALADEIHTTYTGPDGGFWSDSLNWDLGVPHNNASDTFVACINGDLGLDVTVTLDQTAHVSGVVIDAGDVLYVDNSEELRVFTGLVDNAGEIVIGSTGSHTYLRPSGGQVTFTGGGTITLLDSTTSWFYGLSSGWIDNQNNTIQGGGGLGNNSTQIYNGGTIIANAVNPLVVDPNTSGLDNDGDMRAEGATLELRAADYFNDGGTIRAMDAAVVDLAGSTWIHGGTLDTDGSGEIQTSGASHYDGSVDTVTNLGVTRVLNGGDLRVHGVIDNQGTMVVQSTGGHTYLRADGDDTTFMGGGEIHLDASGGTFNWLTSLGGAMLINVDNWIHGGGNIGGNTTQIHNQSLITADDAATMLTIDPNTGGFDNDGTLRAQDGATMELNAGAYDNTGALIEALDASVMYVNGSVNITGGDIETSGSGVVEIHNAPTFDALTMNATVNLTNGADLRLVGPIVNNGLITIASTGGHTYLRPDGSDVVLSGGGEVHLDAANGAFNWLYGLSGATFHNVDNWIHGGGNIGNNSTMTINDHLITADDALTPLEIDANNDGFDNNGTLRAQDGATLIFAAGPYANDGGLIEALPGSTVQINGGAVFTGGTIDTTGSGEVRIANAPTWDGLTTSGTVNLDNGADLRLVNAIVNSGTITVASAGGHTYLRPDGSDVVLSGGGEVHLDASVSSFNWLYGLGGATFTNVDNWIHGGGNIGFNTTAVTNQGTISADSDVALTIDPPAADGFMNVGLLEVTGAGGIVMHAGPFTTSGMVDILPGTNFTRTNDFVQTAGLTNVDGTLTVNTGALVVEGGRVEGNGLIDGDVNNSGGAVAPGSSAGELDVQGLYEQPGGTLEIEIGGSTQGVEYDVLSIDGDANLGGSLVVKTIDGFAPVKGDAFTILTTTGTVNGTFQYADCEGTYVITYLEDSVVVTFQSDIVLGDLNCDHVVDVSDLLLLIAAWGNCPASGACVADLNGDGTVDVSDLLLMLGFWS